MRTEMEVPAVGHVVELGGEALQVVRLGVRREVDVLGHVPTAVRLDRGPADNDEPDLVPNEDLEQLPSAGFDGARYAVTGV
jgi:hypothetical protein